MLIIILFINNTNLAFSDIYNDSYTNLSLHNDGWCVNIDIDFRVYNQTDYENKREIENNLCQEGCEDECEWDVENCTECKSGCLKFHKIKDADVTIYDGPFESSSVLTETTTNDNGEFNYRFTEVSQFLIKINPKEENYNSLYTIFQTNPCVHAQDTIELQNNSPIEKDIEFIYDEMGVTIQLKQTTINNKTDIIISDKSDFVNKLNNTINIFELTSYNSNYENINIIKTIENITDKKLKLYQFNFTNNQWVEKEFTKENSQIKFTSEDMGMFSVVEEVTKQSEVLLEEDNSKELNESLEEENNQEKQTKSNQENIVQNNNRTNVNNDSDKTILILIIAVGSIFLVILIGLKHTKTNKKKEIPTEHKEVLTTYQETYNRTSKYVKENKDSYRKDQIYRALQSAHIPNDIIDKVFREEY